MKVFTLFKMTDLIQQRSSPLVLVVSQLMEWRSPQCSECVSSDCGTKTPVSGRSSPGQIFVSLCLLTVPPVRGSPVEAYVHPVKPCTKDELSTTPLADIIERYSVRVQGKTYRNPLLYLYPDTHRDDAFGRYYTVSGIVSYCTFPLRTNECFYVLFMFVFSLEKEIFSSQSNDLSQE